MAWPKGRARPHKVSGELVSEHEPQPMESVELADLAEMPRALNQPPADWRKGALLNVRNYGDRYVITLWPEEYSQEKSERAMEFTNLGECQAFVSDWYSRQSHDPRAR